MLYKIVVAASIAAASAAQPSYAHRQLQTPVAGATNDLCEACVTAEDALISAITTHEVSIQGESKAAMALTAATTAHSNGEMVLATANTGAAAAKQATAGIIASCRSDAGVDAPASIMGRTEGLNTQAAAWVDALAVVASETSNVAGLASTVRDAESFLRDAQSQASGHDGDVTAARGSADTACSAMRAGGYATDSPSYKAAKAMLSSRKVSTSDRKSVV